MYTLFELRVSFWAGCAAGGCGLLVLLGLLSLIDIVFFTNRRK